MSEKISNRSSYLYNIQGDSVIREIDCREKVGRATYFFGDIAFNKKVTILDDKLHFEVRNIALRIFAGFLAVTVFSLITVIGRILLAISSSQKLLNELAQKLLKPKEDSEHLYPRELNKQTSTALELLSFNSESLDGVQPVLLKPVEVNPSFKDEIQERVTEPKLKPVKRDQKNEEEIYREAVDVKANLKPIQTVDGEAPRPSIQVGEDIGNIIKRNKEESKNNPLPQREIPIVNKLHQSLIHIVDGFVQKMEPEEEQEEDDDTNWITSDDESALDDASLNQNLFKQIPTASLNNDEKIPVRAPKLEEGDHLVLQQRRRSILGLPKQDDAKEEENDW